jgi:glycosyltransferase involved in cell wall biosynthesis
MNILFLTTGTFHSINEKSIYPDLLREFKKNGHEVYIVSTNERRLGKKTEYVDEDGAHLLRVKIGNLRNTNLIEKGISTLLIESQFKAAIGKYLSDVKFDMVMYSTPPITLVSAIEYVKKRDGAKTYLLLKDIFPQNAVDIGIMSKTGMKGLLYKHFRRKEKKLYAISDHIGCMSQANVDYVINHNPEVDPTIVEVCPNCIEVIDKSVDGETRRQIREKYGIPLNKKVFVYGGNLGKPQGIPFLIECLEKCKDIEGAFFLVVGNGTEYGKLETYANSSSQKNFKLMSRLPKEDYDTMVGACDVGLIFLDHRFTIPNFPSRLLSYMQAKIPVLAVTDPNTDIGKVIVDGGFGWWCESNDVEDFVTAVKDAVKADTRDMADTEFQFLRENYSSAKAHDIICNSLKRE